MRLEQAGQLEQAGRAGWLRHAPLVQVVLVRLKSVLQGVLQGSELSQRVVAAEEALDLALRQYRQPSGTQSAALSTGSARRNPATISRCVRRATGGRHPCQLDQVGLQL